MLPESALSTTPVPGSIIEGKAQTQNFLVDYASGGIGFNNPSQGLLYQVWKGEVLNTRDVYISAPNTPQTFIVSGGYAITEISISFDQNMRPYVAYVAGGVAYLYWFDSTIPGPAIMTFTTDVKNPRLTLDDKRPESLASSDIILAYLRNNNLYFRVQRERFQIEHLLATGITQTLMKIGMNDKYRLQFEFGIKKSVEEIQQEMARGSEIASSEFVIPDDSTTPSSSDIWELERKD